MEPNFQVDQTKVDQNDSLNMVSKAKPKKLFYSNLIWSSLIYTIVAGLIIYFFTINSEAIKANVNSMGYIFAILAITLILVVYTFLMVISIWSVLYDETHFKEKLFYALFSLNLIRFYLVCQRSFKKGLLKWKFQKWTVLDVALIGMSIAVLMVLKTVDMVMPAIPPLFISLSIHYLALFFISYITGSFLKTFFVGFVSGWMMLFFPTTTFLSFPQFLFDYVIPMLGFSLTFFINFQAKERKTWLQLTQWISFITIPFIVVYLSRVVAGVLFWANGSWTGVSVWIFSGIINGINTGFDLFTSLIIVPAILDRLQFLKEKYQQRINH